MKAISKVLGNMLLGQPCYWVIENMMQWKRRH